MSEKTPEENLVRAVEIIMAASIKLVNDAKKYEGTADDLKKAVKANFAAKGTKRPREKKEKKEEEAPAPKEKEKKEKSEVCPGLHGKDCGAEGKHKKKVTGTDGKGKMVLLCDDCLTIKVGEDKLAKQAAKKKKKAEEPKKQKEEKEEGEEEEEEEESD